MGTARGHTRLYRFVQVDVFSTRIVRANPLAVILDARGLSDDQTRENIVAMNLTETTFVLLASRAGHGARLAGESGLGEAGRVEVGGQVAPLVEGEPRLPHRRRSMTGARYSRRASG